MGRERGEGKGKAIQDNQSSSSEEQDRASDDEYRINVHSKRTMPQDPLARAQSRGRGESGNPMLQKRTTSGPKIGARTKKARTGDEGDRYDDDIDLSIYEKTLVPIHPSARTRKDPKLVDYSKHANDIKPFRFRDPWVLPRNFFCDDRFWRAHQVDWYE
jgi:hypothetical protein